MSVVYTHDTLTKVNFNPDGIYDKSCLLNIDKFLFIKLALPLAKSSINLFDQHLSVLKQNKKITISFIL